MTFQERFFVHFYTFFTLNAPFSRIFLVVAYALVNFFAVKKIDILVNYSLKGERTDIKIGNSAKTLYHITLAVASVKRNHYATVIDTVKIVGIIVGLAFNSQVNAENGLFFKSRRLLLFGEEVEIRGKLKCFVHAVEVSSAESILTAGIIDDLAVTHRMVIKRGQIAPRGAELILERRGEGIVGRLHSYRLLLNGR